MVTPQLVNPEAMIGCDIGLELGSGHRGTIKITIVLEILYMTANSRYRLVCHKPSLNAGHDYVLSPQPAVNEVIF